MTAATTPGRAASVTDGQAAWLAYEAAHAAAAELDEANGFMPVDNWYWEQATDSERAAWEAAARAAQAGLLAERDHLRSLVAEVLGWFKRSGAAHAARVGQVALARTYRAAGLGVPEDLRRLT